MSTLIVFANANTASNMSDRSGHRMNLQVQDSVHILIRRVLVLGNACRLNNLSMHVCMYVCMYNLFKLGKNYKDSKLYLQDIQLLIKTDDTDIK